MTATATRHQAIDIDLIASQITVALQGEHDAERTASRYEGLAFDARETARVRRVEIGTLLLKARPAWPASGPNAKGWSEFLARVKLDDSTAVRYMHEARGDSAPQRAKTPRESALIAELERMAPEARARVLAACKVNVNGGSGETSRGAWITAKKWADAVGPWDLDPFSNPRSHIVSTDRCMLEDGGDGLYVPATVDGLDHDIVGYWRSGSTTVGRAFEGARVWGQPPYDIVERAVAHYRHTRFCFLLRFDPSTGWFRSLWERTAVIAIPLGDREMFEPPPELAGAKDNNPHAHAFYYSDVRDVTNEIRRACIVLRRDEAAPQLHIVKGT